MGTGGQRQSLLLVTSVASDRLLSPLSPCSHQWIRPLGKAERGYRCFGFCAQMIHSLCDEGPGSCGAWRCWDGGPRAGAGGFGTAPHAVASPLLSALQSSFSSFHMLK